MKELKIIKSASIILQKTTGEVFLCKRSKDVSFFPGFWVFPGGKIENKLPDNWSGTELEVKETVFKEMYEEIGIVVGLDKTISPEERKMPFLTINYNDDLRDEFTEKMVYVGKKQTPPFRKKLYNAAYFWIQDEIIDTMEPIVDGKELEKGEWIQPEMAVKQWENGEKLIPPPVLHLLRNLQSAHFVIKTLNETIFPIGLQTKVEFAPGYQLIPFSSNTIPPFFNTNMVIVESEENILLVDPGAQKEAYDHLQEILQSLPSTPQVFITHHHKDHWEGLKIIEDIFPEASIMSHPDTLSRLTTNLKPKPITDGKIILGNKKLEVIQTPGHTDSHMSLFDAKQKLLIAGDHVVGFGSAVLDPSSGSMKDYFETTKMLINLDPKLVFPAHGPPNFAGTKLLNYYLKHRKEREDSILEAITDGKNTLDEIVETVYQDVPEEMWGYAKRNIALHIEKLDIENRLPESFRIEEN